MNTTTEHTYRGYTFTADRRTGQVQILTRRGLEWMSALDALAFIDAAWGKFDRVRDEVIAGKSEDIVKEALTVAINSWEYDGEHGKAKAAADIINGSRADNPDFLAGAGYVVDYVENELGIDLSETGLEEFREENQE